MRLAAVIHRGQGPLTPVDNGCKPHRAPSSPVASTTSTTERTVTMARSRKTPILTCRRSWTMLPTGRSLRFGAMEPS